ncbi:MAG: hypothetical protein KIT09_11165 [Bryobacteraceae bacterium]|nr:hypothetical protein [Bryobacteraceae bacterium]
MVFRLTQDEYRRLQKACSSTGARSISDFTRKELLDKASSPADGLHSRLTVFERRLSELQSAVRQINSLLKRLADSNQS